MTPLVPPSEPWNESAEDRASRLERLAEAVRSGTYEVPVSDVVTAIIATYNRSYPLRP